MSDFDPSKYFVTYSIDYEKEGLQAAEIPRGKGGTHAIFMASIMYPAGGSLSVLFDSVDGRTGAEPDDIEWFKIWSMLGIRLSRSSTLGGWQYSTVTAATKMVGDIMQKFRETDPTQEDPEDSDGH